MMMPGLTFSQVGTAATPRIRGVGNSSAQAGNENAVATYVDGVYMASAIASVLSFNNIEQVAVLRGPQGTLFGRNATGGVIQIKTLDPVQEFGGKASVGYGNLNTVTANLYVTGGVSPALSADLAVYFSDQADGFGTNLANGLDVNETDTTSIRSKWLYDNDGATTARLIFDYTKTSSSNPAFRPVSGSLPATGVMFSGGDFDVDTDVQPFSAAEQYGVSLDLEHTFGDLKLSSITAYRKSDWDLVLDADMLPVPFIGIVAESPDKQFSQELQLQSIGGGSLDWTVGLYYLKAEGSYDPVIFDGAAILDFLQTVNSTIETESFAVFGQGTYAISDQTNLTLGGRFTTENKDYNATQSVFIPSINFTIPGATSGETKDENFTWRAVLDHQFSDNFMAYVSANRGFKSGGFDNTNGAASLPFLPEELDAFEVGFKTEMWDRRVRVNSSAFYYDYKNMQLNNFSGGLPVITNAASAKIKGLELEVLAAATENLTISATMALLDSEFGDFLIEPTVELVPNGVDVFGGVGLGAAISAEGNRIPFSPDFTGSIGFDYRVPLETGSLGFTSNYFYSDGFFAAEDNRLQQESYSLINTSATWYIGADENYNIRLWGKNLGNTAHVTQLASQIGFVDFVSMAAGRTYGVSIGAKF
jgi:iron complex outermembrane receptor protein